MVTVLLTHHLLYDDCHLLLVDDILRSRHICLGVTVIYRGIDAFDSLREVGKHLLTVIGVRYHIGAVYTSKWLIVAVLK